MKRKRKSNDARSRFVLHELLMHSSYEKKERREKKISK
jgi:hypothetical protein